MVLELRIELWQGDLSEAGCPDGSGRESAAGAICQVKAHHLQTSGLGSESLSISVAASAVRQLQIWRKFRSCDKPLQIAHKPMNTFNCVWARRRRHDYLSAA
eukprot:SAG31_NODE_4332_length_3345_cov_2.605052_2_plen_102_part_00